MKFHEMSIHSIKYHNITQTSQPVKKTDILITFFGQAEINNHNYNIMTVLEISHISGTFKITNQILNIFM
jgi:hypothetical protein